MIHLRYKAKQKGEVVANLSGIDLMLANPEQPVSDVWKEMLTYAHVRGRNHPLVGAAAGDMIDRPATEAGSVLSTDKKFLALHRDPVVSRNIIHSKFKVHNLRKHEEHAA